VSVFTFLMLACVIVEVIIIIHFFLHTMWPHLKPLLMSVVKRAASPQKQAQAQGQAPAQTQAQTQAQPKPKADAPNRSTAELAFVVKHLVSMSSEDLNKFVSHLTVYDCRLMQQFVRLVQVESLATSSMVKPGRIKNRVGSVKPSSDMPRNAEAISVVPTGGSPALLLDEAPAMSLIRVRSETDCNHAIPGEVPE